jgi:hypothetical protein
MEINYLRSKILCGSEQNKDFKQKMFSSYTGNLENVRYIIYDLKT